MATSSLDPHALNSTYRGASPVVGSALATAVGGFTGTEPAAKLKPKAISSKSVKNVALIVRTVSLAGLFTTVPPSILRLRCLVPGCPAIAAGGAHGCPVRTLAGAVA
jgi:hypothetical protein